MAEALTVRAPAKINLVLEVLGLRPDGYHEIDTILQPLALVDDVTITFGSSPGVDVAGPYAAGTPAGPENLVWKAAAKLAGIAGRSCDDLHFSLFKRIPPAGGLGGGAGDAAAVINALGDRWKVPQEARLEVAAAIGSDEPALVLGGTVRARGRGELVERVRALPPHHVVLFVPEATLERKTARLFEALGATPFDPGGGCDAFLSRASDVMAASDVHNAFERVAFEVFEGLGALRTALQQRIGEPVHLAGAGPCLFWIGASERVAGAALDAAAGLPCEAIPTMTASA